MGTLTDLQGDSVAQTIERYLRLGLSFDLLEAGFVDAYTGDPSLRRYVMNCGTPDPRQLAAEARDILKDIPSLNISPARRSFLQTHLRALEMSARKFAGDPVEFVDEVNTYFNVDISMTDTSSYEAAHAELNELLPGSGSLRERVRTYRQSLEIPANRLDECVRAFTSALRDVARETFPLPDAETIDFEIVSDKPWSGFNYYLGAYRSKVAVNSDVPQLMPFIPHLVAHEAYPGHHTEHCRKEAELVHNKGELEQTIFLVNTPQCLMAEGLADHALEAVMGKNWGPWAEEIYADLGLRVDGHTAQRWTQIRSVLGAVRQDMALMLHQHHRDIDDVIDYSVRWGLESPERARQSLGFLTNSLWRAYISTYVEGYALLEHWMDHQQSRGIGRNTSFARLLDEPLTPEALRAELGQLH